MEEAVNQSQAYRQSQEQSAGDIGNTSNNVKVKRTPLGMSSFNKEDQNAFGQSLRLAMALIQGAEIPKPSPHKALRTDATAIATRLKSLGKDNASNLANRLDLIVRFDDLQGWKASGARHCAAYMNLELGISLSLSWDFLRAGRKLGTLPVTRTLFRAGELTWSKVRLITRVANEDNVCAC